MKARHSIFWALSFNVLLLCFAGCASQPAEQGAVPAGNAYATGFQITPTDSGTVVEVFQPYQRVCIKEPMRRLGTMSTVQVGFLYAIDAIDYLAAVCNPELIYTPIKGDETDLGDSMKPSAERTLQAGLDALLAVNYGQYDNLEAARLEKLGVFTIYINEWQEGSPLARAEWIRVLGALTGKLHEADSVFHEVETRYNELAVSGKRRSVKIMSGNNFRGTWYVPSGKNYLAYLFKDAGAEYPFYNNERETSKRHYAISMMLMCGWEPAETVLRSSPRWTRSIPGSRRMRTGASITGGSNVCHQVRTISGNAGSYIRKKCSRT